LFPRSHRGAGRKLALQRLARLQDIVDQNDERARFAAIAADLFAPFFGVAAVSKPVAVPWLTTAFAFFRRIAGV
jgi:hypothetical protein